jgi:S1-C subfamily serine protease
MKKRTTLTLAILAAVTLVACQLSSLVPTAAAPTAVPAPTMALPVVSSDVNGQENLLTAIYAQASPGVVSIYLYDSTGSLLGSGSGWVYSMDGYIVTDDHVVESASKLEIDFINGDKAFGTLVGADPYSDLAVIKVDVPASDLHPLVIGNSDNVQVGQTVIAIGNPYGYLSNTMTTGIVSAKGRSQPSEAQTTTNGYFSVPDLIQTDAAINPGNSGGPLLNLSGEVIGVNRSIASTSTTSSGQPANSGIGFAIASNLVKRVVPSLIANGKVNYSYLGISAASVSDFTLDAINSLGLKSNTGAYILNVVAGGPADKAGIRAAGQATGAQSLGTGGDLVIAADGQQIQYYDDLIRYLVYNKQPGDTIVLTVLRGNQKVDVTVTLGARP